MKRKLLGLLLAGLTIFSLAGCQKQEQPPQEQDQVQSQDQDKPQDSPEGGQAPADQPEEGVTVRVAALKGPTAMGMVKWMEDAAQGQSQGSYEIGRAHV